MTAFHVALCVLSQIVPDGHAVVIERIDGSREETVLLLAKIAVRQDGRDGSFPLAEIRRLDFGPDQDAVVLLSGDYRGKILTAEFPVKNAKLESATLTRDGLKSMTIGPAALAGPDGPLAVAEKSDGTRLVGTIQSRTIRLKRYEAEEDVSVLQLRSIQLREGTKEWTAQAPDSHWPLLTESFPFKMAGGETATIARDSLRSLRVIGRPPAAASEPGLEMLKPVASVGLKSAVPSFFLSPDRKWVYLYNASENELRRVDTAARTLDPAAVSLADGTTGVCMSPDGKTVYAHALPHGRDAYLKKVKGPGSIQVVDAVAFKVQRTFSIDAELDHAAADDLGRIFAAGRWIDKGPSNGICVVDAKKGAIAARWTGPFGVPMLKADQKRLYWSSEGVAGVAIPAKLQDTPRSVHGDGSGRCELTADGAFAVGRSGKLFRLAKSDAADLAPLERKLESLTATASDAGCPCLIAAGADGILRSYTMPDFALKRCIWIDRDLYRGVLDAKAKLLYATPAVRISRSSDVVEPRAGDLLIYDVSRLLD